MDSPLSKVGKAEHGITKQDIIPSYTYAQTIRLCEAQASATLRIRYGIGEASVSLVLKREVTRKHPIPPEYDLTTLRVTVPAEVIAGKFRDWAEMVAAVDHYWRKERERNLSAGFSQNKAYIIWNFVRQSATFNSMKDDMTGKPWAHFK